MPAFVAFRLDYCNSCDAIPVCLLLSGCSVYKIVRHVQLSWWCTASWVISSALTAATPTPPPRRGPRITYKLWCSLMYRVLIVQSFNIWLNCVKCVLMINCDPPLVRTTFYRERINVWLTAYFLLFYPLRGTPTRLNFVARLLTAHFATVFIF